MKFIKFFDLYADNVQLYLNERRKIKTEFGGFLTIIMILVIASFAWLIGKDLYYKKNPYYYQQSSILSEYPEVNVNPVDFPLAMSFQDLNGNVFYDDRYLQLQITYNQYFINKEGEFEYNKTLLEFEKCNYTHFPSQTKENLDKISITNFFCIKQPYNISLVGYWSESKVNYLQVSAVICKDKFFIPGYCKNKTEVDKLIGERGLNLNLYFLDYELTISNFTNPYRQFFVSPYKFLTRETKYITYMIEKEKLSTDEGLILDDRSDVQILRCVELQNDVSIFSDEIGHYIDYEFYSSNKSVISNRKYIKISEIIASAGGLYNVFSIVFYFINLPVCIIKRNIDIIENLFEYSKKNKKIKHSSDFLNSNNLSFTVIDVGSMNRNKKIEEKIKSVIKKEKLEFSFYDYLVVMIRYFSNNNEQSYRNNINIYEKGTEFIQNNFDLENIFKNIIEYQFLKKLILKDHQMYFLSKLQVSFENERFHGNKFISNYKENDNYFSLLTSEHKSEIDSKLIELLLE